jgi:hypothetical protein
VKDPAEPQQPMTLERFLLAGHENGGQ